MLEEMMSQQNQELKPRTAQPIPENSDKDLPAAFSVQTLREARGLSQLDLASKAGMLPDHLRAVEAGLQITIVERQVLAAALGVPIETIA